MTVRLNELTLTRSGRPDLSGRPDGFRLGPVTLTVAPGETLLVAGGNGSGKSTLAQALCGWHPEWLRAALTGEGTILEQALSGMPLFRRAAGVQLVQQNPLAQLSGCAFSVEEEVAFGPENLGLREADIFERLEESLTLTECQPLRQRDPATLSGGEAQRVVLAAALVMRPQLLLLDEAFSRLSPDAILRMLVALETFRARHGTTLIYFERHLYPVAQYASRVLVLQEGAVTALTTPEMAQTAALIAGVVVPDTSPGTPHVAPDGENGLPPNTAAEIAQSLAGQHPATALQLENITFAWPEASPCLRGLSLTLTPGATALTGPNGAGKSTLLRVAAGLLTSPSGIVKFNGQPLAALRAQERAATMGVLFQEAERQIFHATVEDEVLFGLRRQTLDAQTCRVRCSEALALCGLERVAHAHPLDLHAGQRRMVAVACLAALRPTVLLLDEPSRDFDACWLRRFEDWLRQCRVMGAIILAISHDMDFVARNFDRTIRLEDGCLIDIE